MKAGKLSRRDFMGLLAGIGTGALLAACVPQAVPVTTEGEKEGEKEEAVAAAPEAAIEATLEIWTYPRTENDAELVYKPMMAKFMELHPNIKPEIDVQPWSGRREKLYAAVAAGTPPDIWYATTDTLPTYINKDVILPLSDKLTPEDLADYSEAEIGAASANGQLYMPLVEAEVNGIAYNGALLRELGYDPETAKFETWDELFALGEKAKAKGWYLESLSTFDWAEWLVTVHEAGGAVYTEDRSKSLMTEQPAIDALTRWVMEYKNGWVPLEYAVGSVDEERGLPDYWLSLEQVTHRREDAACWRDTQSNPKLEYVFGHPRHKDTSLPYVSGLVSGQGWAITKLSKNKEAAVIWIKFMIQPENIGLFSTLAGTTPVGNKSKTYWKPDPCVLEHIKRFSPYLFAGADINTLWQESKVVAGPHFQAAVLGQETVEQALEAIDKELNALLKEKYS
jgi:multiple sugar transport system substrate-binding protein